MNALAPKQTARLALAYCDLLRAIALLPPPTTGLWMDADNFEAMRDHVEDVAKLVDNYFRNIGETCAGHCNGFDTSLFESPCFDAVAGNALYALDSAARDMRSGEQHERQMRSDPGYRRLAAVLGLD